jgi:TonB-dependent SusC/RagA subfamily outer membrane receptor
MKKLFLFITVLIFAMGSAFAQRTITGTITDDTGEALIGANILVKGTSVGAVTDLDGNYTLQVPEGSNMIIVSYTGYETQELELGASNVLDITMSEGILLTEAVVTALGISREKKSLGYSVQDVKGEELIVARDPNAINALSGRVAGLQIISSSGNVGSSNRVIIRGNSSISGNNEPLYVINGIPMDNGSYSGNAQYGGVDYGNAMSDLNPDDIESISVLKGPNAAALYGSRAANGVILVTTKSGKGTTKGIGVSYSGTIGFSNPFRLPKYQDKFGQGGGYQFNYVDGTNTAPGSLNDGVDESWGPSFDVNINE